MNESNNHINYSYTDIEKYWKGQLSASEMHAMEKAALDDPFLAEAIEGYQPAAMEGRPFTAEMEELEQRLVNRVPLTKVVPIRNNNWWKIAAVVFLAVAGVWLYTAQNSHRIEKDIADNSKEKSQKSKSQDRDTLPSLHSPVALSDSGKDVAINDFKNSNNNKTKPGTVTNSVEKRSAQLISSERVTNNLHKALAGKTAGLRTDKENAPVHDELAKNIITKKAASNASPSAFDNTSNRAKVKEDENKALENSTSLVNTFKGLVLDSLNRPVEFATVKIPGQQLGSVTNKQGYFSLKSADTTLSVSVASVGFKPANVTLKTNDALPNRIILQPQNNALNEVVVNGLGTFMKKKDLKGAVKSLSVKVLETEPTVSWKEYNEYLEKNKRVTDDNKDIHGEVVVSFDVLEKGRMRKFKIQKSLNEDLDEEAIRLISEGPAWRLLNGKRARASVIVTF